MSDFEVAYLSSKIRKIALDMNFSYIYVTLGPTPSTARFFLFGSALNPLSLVLIIKTPANYQITLQKKVPTTEHQIYCIHCQVQQSRQLR